MNVLERLGQVLTKNGVKSSKLRPERITLNMFEEALPSVAINNTKGVIPREPKNLIVKNNMNLVGKGSSFQKKVVKEYLSPLKAHPFCRHQIRDDYEVERAVQMSNWKKSIQVSKRSQELIINTSHQFIGDMLAVLISCTPKTVKIMSDDVVRTFPTFTMKHVPKVPQFNHNAPQVFEDYIGLLTHTNFLYKNSSRLNGIVPKLLRNLMHPGNIKTMSLRTTQSYNDMIYYFSEKFDFATCREIFVQMKIEGISRNTATYNLMLRSILKNSHLRKTKVPDTEILYYLRRMQAEHIFADCATWTTCYNFLKEDISRLIFIEQMEQRNIPINQRFLYTVLRNGTYTSKDCLKFLSSYDVPLDQRLFNLCIRNLLTEGRSDIAWVFMEHTLKKNQKNFRIGAETLNSFLRLFAEKGRLDMALITFNSCVNLHGMHPNTQTFDILFKAFTKNGYSKNFPVIFEFLQTLRNRWGLGNRTSYWSVRSRSMIKFNTPKDKNITKLDLESAEKKISALTWDSVPTGFTKEVWKNSGSDIRKILRYLSCIPKSLKTEGLNFQGIPGKTEKMKQYRKRIRFIALQNAMYKRLPYAKDWYKSLKDELQERDVISKG